MGWGGRGRGRGFGLGMGFSGGMGFGPGLGMGFGRGMGFSPNPYWSCRWFPWLPRGWWRFPASYGYGTPYGAPYPPTTGVPVSPQFPPMWPYGASPMVQPGIIPPVQEREMLEQNLKFLNEQLGEIRRRLSELES